MLPSATGTGGCASSTTSGTALITWADGTRTITQYSTTGSAAADCQTGVSTAGIEGVVGLTKQ